MRISDNMTMKTFVLSLAVFCALALSSIGFAQTATQVPDYYLQASKTIGKDGTLNADGSFRINLPRKDVQFTNENGMEIPADMGLATYAAFTGTEKDSLVVGDVAMLAPEINGVIDALRAGKIEVVALHNHMTTESPRLFFLHYQGRGAVQELAITLQKAFSVLGKVNATVNTEKPGKPSVDWDAVQAVFGVKPQTFPSGVVRFANPRKDIKVSVDDLPFLPGMGLASWAAFSTCECGKTMVMGDTCIGSRAELQAVIDALRKADVSITAIHNHIFQGSREVLFLHFEGEGDALQMSKGIKSGWDVLGSMSR